MKSHHTTKSFKRKFKGEEDSGRGRKKAEKVIKANQKCQLLQKADFINSFTWRKSEFADSLQRL